MYQKCIDTKICPICKRLANDIKEDDSSILQVQCSICGTYYATREIIDDEFECKDGKYDLTKLHTYLFYNSSKSNSKMLLSESYTDEHYFRLTPEIVENWYPKSFGEKIDLILVKLDELAKYDGARVPTKPFVETLLFCSDKSNDDLAIGYDLHVQLDYVNDFLEENRYVNNFGSYIYQLTPKALERIYALRKEQSNNKNVFVSMAFNDGTKQTREAIRSAIIDSGYSPEFIDEIIHNKQIVPEMFRLIRECKFLILEISDPNYGAYYEAGYAMGLGKEVIICCKEEIFKKEYVTEEEKKHLKPHFDIAQKQTLVWKDEDDLIKKLSEWIKALF